MTATTTFKTVLSEVQKHFIQSTRNDGTQFYKFGDDAPEWLHGSDVAMTCHKALDDRFPDDWVYEQMSSVADGLCDRDVDDGDGARDAMGEIADGLVDVYNADRTKWLASNLNNALLCDEAVEEMGSSDTDMFQRIALGQYMAIEHIGCALIECIEEEADNREQEEPEA